jgi:hypothetical protein
VAEMLTNKLIEETKRLIRWRIFLDKCGLAKYDFRAKELRNITSKSLKVKLF